MQLELRGLCEATGLRQAFAWAMEVLECETWTRRMHCDHVRYLLAYFGDVPVKSIGYVQIREYYLSEKRRGLSKESVRKRLSTLRMTLREGVARGVIERLPEWPVIRSDTRRKEGFWTLTEWEAAHLACDDEEFRTWIAVGFFTGMHTIDLNRFRWEDVDIVRGTWVRRNKKTKARPAVLPLPDRLKTILRERYDAIHPHPRDLVSGHSMGHPNREIKDLARRAGIPVISPIEAARHSCETHLEEQGTTPAFQIHWLGLTSERMLRHYKHVSTARVAESMVLVNAHV